MCIVHVYQLWDVDGGPQSGTATRQAFDCTTGACTPAARSPPLTVTWLCSVTTTVETTAAVRAGLWADTCTDRSVSLRTTGACATCPREIQMCLAVVGRARFRHQSGGAVMRQDRDD